MALRALRPSPPTLRIPDDRGVFHPLAERDAPWAPADARLRRVRHQQSSLLTGGAREWLPFLLVGPVLLVALGMGTPPALMYGVLVALCLAWVWFGIARANRRMADEAGDLAQQWSDPALRRGLCPVCEYNLHGVAPEPDGCVPCPECGSAWRQTRIGPGTAAPPAQPAPISSAIEPLGLNAIRLMDDQGRSHRAEGLRAIIALAQAPPERLATLGGVVRGLRRRSAWLRIVLATLLLAPLLGTLAMLSIPTWTLRFSAIAAPLIFLWFVIMILRSDIGVKPGLRIRELAAASFCPVCGGDLEAETPDDRGMISCPDCGARWRSSS